MLEIGVYEGGVLRELALENPHISCWGFDTFEGLPPNTALDTGFFQEGDLAVSLEMVEKFMEGVNNVTLVKGLFPTSAKGLVLNDIVMASVDVDLYQGTLESMEYLIPRMAKGSRIYCDDAFVGRCEGATIAMCEISARLKKVIKLEKTAQHAYFQF